MKPKSIPASLLAVFIIFLLPINVSSGVLYLKNGKAIANAKDIEIKDQDVHYTVGGKAHRIKMEDVKKIEWISNEVKKDSDPPADETQKSKGKSSADQRADCHDLGWSFGKCATLSAHGKRCNPKDDVVIPPVCRGLEDTKNGMITGIKEARILLGLPPE